MCLPIHKGLRTVVTVETNLHLNIGKKYLKTANIIDESLILAIVLRNYSTKPSYIFQLERELKVWKYIFNLFHFEMLIHRSVIETIIIDFCDDDSDDDMG
jgi:hypothetical protein